MKSILIVILAVITLTACVPAKPISAAIVQPGFEVEEVASGFTLPTAMAFAPDGRIFVAEKGGSVRVIKNGELLPTPVITLTDINTFGDRGLIGIATDPNFSSNGYLYLSYSFENTPGSSFGGPKTGRIVRVTVVGDTASESSKLVLLGTVGGDAANPSCENYPVIADCIASDTSSHSVGGLRFGPDGKLYATLGDGSDFTTVDPRALRAQNLDSLAGKVIRINPDGTAPSDNPFFDGNPLANRSKVFAYGVRNAFRLNFHPVSGKLFLGDVGWSNWEEVNRVTPGVNFGWPCWEGNTTTSYNCQAHGVTLPTYVYAHNSAGAGSITVGAFPANSAYPAQYNNSLFIGDYAQNWIKILNFDSNNNVASVDTLVDDTVWPVDLSTGPDGNVYYIDIAFGSINRITHTTGNRKPLVNIAANPTSGLSPLTVEFSSAGSSDPDGDAVSYLWDFADGTTSNLSNPQHVFNNGSYDVSLTLTDIHGAQSSKSITITVGNQAPTANITSPSSGSLYTPLQNIQLTGSAVDPEDGVLPPSAFHWQLILHHNTHIHYLQTFDGVTSPSFIADDHNATDVYTEVILTVTDSGGLQHSHSINLYQNNGTGSGNLINNPSVEIEDPNISNKPLNWHQGWYGEMNPIFTYPVLGFEGDRALKLEITSHTSGDAKWYFDPVAVTSGQVYEFSNYYTSTVQTEQVAQFGLSNGTYNYVPLGHLPPAGEPTQVVRTITIPEGVQTLSVFHELESTGELITDNFSLTLIEEADTEAPVVSITAPTDHSQVIQGDNVSVEVSATDNVAVVSVKLLVDGQQFGAQDSEAPFGFVLPTGTLPFGDHVLSVEAQDAAGNIGVSVSNTLKIISSNLILNPSLETAGGNGDPEHWLRGGWGNHTRVFTYPEVGFDGNKAAKVEITTYPVDGTGDAKWYFEPVTVLPGTVYTFSDRYKASTISDIIGRYTLSNGSFHYFGLIKELPPTANWTEVSATFAPPADAISVTFLHLISYVGFITIDDARLYASGTGTPAETEAPTATFISPLNGDTVSGTVNIQADATDNVGITHVLFSVNGNILGSDTTIPFSWPWDSTTVPDGQHALKITSHDPSGNNTATTIIVTVDNAAPPPPPPPPSGNLILNPSLETAGAGGSPENWLKGGWGTNDRVHTYPVAGQEGSAAARVEVSTFTDGDAKWFFADVPVVPGQTYDLSHYYKSNTTTNVTLRYTLSGGSFQYSGVGNLAPAADWTSHAIQFVPPQEAVSVTLFHSLISAGWLEVDNYSLSEQVTAGVQTFDKGKVSLTFDDGWLSQYSEAYQILNNAGVKGGFYIISTDTANAEPGEQISNPSLEEVGGTGDPTQWLRGGWGTNDRVHTYPVPGISGGNAAKVSITSYTSGDAKWYFADVPVLTTHKYIISNNYNSTVPTEVLLRYTLTDGSFQYAYLAGLPATGGAWQNFSQLISIPANAVSVTMFHVLAQIGELTVDNFSLKIEQVFVDPAQMLEMQLAGHEIGSHTKTHPHLTQISLVEQQDEIVNSRLDLLAMGVSTVDTLVYPYGDYNAAVQGIAQGAGYIGARSVDRGFNFKDTDKFALKIQQIDRTVTLADVEAWVEQAEAENTWLILMFHQIDDDPAHDLGTTPELLQQMVDYIKLQNVDIITMREGLGLMNP